jgi:hypothetical protein
MMSRDLSFLSVLLVIVGCMPAGVQGGSNANDRSSGGDQGEVLLTGAMIVSPDGNYIVAQRNQTSILVDLAKQVGREFPQQFDRFVFTKSGSRGYAVLSDHTTVAAYDLAAFKELWRVHPSFETAAGVSLAKLSGDDTQLVLGDQSRLFVLNAADGKEQTIIDVGSQPTELAWIPGSNQALVLGTTSWTDHVPGTTMLQVDFSSGSSKTTLVQNCSAPIVVTPDATRAFVSPTFCEEAGSNSGAAQWTNPDPVSVIDLAPTGPNFIKNLPGFGPVALDPAGNRLIAYLDTQRMDASLFDDRQQVPSLTGPRYYILIIDPQALSLRLAPVGDELPRFALARDGHTLIVDATVQQVRGEAKVSVSIDSSGHITADLHIFGSVGSPLGAFDTETAQYRTIAGAGASLDRFVQLADAKHVYTLRTTADGMGGDLYRVDLDALRATSLGKSLRDIGLLADQTTLVLRERLPAAKVPTSAGYDWYRREQFCLSVDGVTCGVAIEFQDSVPFQSGGNCVDYHDC